MPAAETTKLANEAAMDRLRARGQTLKRATIPLVRSGAEDISPRALIATCLGGLGGALPRRRVPETLLRLGDYLVIRER